MIQEMLAMSVGGGESSGTGKLVRFELAHPTVNSNDFNITVSSDSETYLSENQKTIGTNSGNNVNLDETFTCNGHTVRWVSTVVYGTTPSYTLPVEITIDGTTYTAYNVTTRLANFSSVGTEYFYLII